MADRQAACRKRGPAAVEPPEYVGATKTCTNRGSSDHSVFKFLNNKKPDQPRYRCTRCKKYYTHYPPGKARARPHGKKYQPRYRCTRCKKYYTHYPPGKARARPHGKKYDKHTLGIPPGHAAMFDLRCPSLDCRAQNLPNPHFLYSNNNKPLQPRYKCLACQASWQPKLKDLLPRPHDVAPMLQYPNVTGNYGIDPSYIDPTYIDPNYIDPTYIDPTYIDPTYIDPTYIDPTYIDPTYIDPTYIDPTYIDPTYIDPNYIDPTYIDPTYIDPNYIDPNYIDPTYIDPNYIDPNYIDPNYIDPTYINPTYIDPNYIDPSYMDPSYIDPNYIHPNYIDPNYIDPNFIDPNYIDPNYIDPNYIDPNFIDPNYIDPNMDAMQLGGDSGERHALYHELDLASIEFPALDADTKHAVEEHDASEADSNTDEWMMELFPNRDAP